MVDIIKSFSHGSTAFPLKSHLSRPKPINHQVTLPIFVSHTDNVFSSNDRINNNQTKRWIGNLSPNPFARLIDVSNTPYSLHRKIMYQELSRRCPITVDSSKGSNNKHRNLGKERTKTSTTTGTTTTTTATATTTALNGGLNGISQASFSNGDIQSSRLFDTLSKHVTIKAEPLRPTNTFNSLTTQTLTSWQKYWTSTHAQRRRKEATDPEPEPELEPVFYRPKREKPSTKETQIVVQRDSPHPNSRLHQYDIPIPSPPHSNTSTKTYNPATTPDKEISERKEGDSKRTTPQICTADINASSFIPSSIDMHSSIIASKASVGIPTIFPEKDDEQHLNEKSLLLSSSSSHFRSDSQIIEDVSEAQIDPQPITTNVYRLISNDDKSKKQKRSPSRRRRTRSKTPEKRRARTPSVNKRKRHPSPGKKTCISSDLSTFLATSRSKYSEKKWDRPYVGLRFDPPTPPSSPSLFLWLEDSDQEDNDTPREKVQFFEPNLSPKVAKN